MLFVLHSGHACSIALPETRKRFPGSVEHALWRVILCVRRLLPFLAASRSYSDTATFLVNETEQRFDRGRFNKDEYLIIFSYSVRIQSGSNWLIAFDVNNILLIQIRIEIGTTFTEEWILGRVFSGTLPPPPPHPADFAGADDVTNLGQVTSNALPNLSLLLDVHILRQ